MALVGGEGKSTETRASLGTFEGTDDDEKDKGTSESKKRDRQQQN